MDTMTLERPVTRRVKTKMSVRTKLVRELMKNMTGNPSSLVYTNQCVHCHTIKTYANDTDGSIRKALDAALREAGSVGHRLTVIRRDPVGHRVPGNSLIVRLPKDENLVPID